MSTPPYTNSFDAVAVALDDGASMMAAGAPPPMPLAEVITIADVVAAAVVAVSCCAAAAALFMIDARCLLFRSLFRVRCSLTQLSYSHADTFSTRVSDTLSYKTQNSHLVMQIKRNTALSLLVRLGAPL